MNIKTIGVSVGMLTCFVCSVVAQKAQDVFFPALYWGENSGKGVIHTKPKELVVLDSQGNKHQVVASAEDITGVYVSPTGKKLVYTTATSIWLVALESGAAQLVSKGDCYYLRWNADGLSFMFSVGEYRKEDSPVSASFKLFWADGDGKNLKQVYP